MKRIIMPFLLLGVVFALAPAVPLGAADTTGPRVSRKALAAMEKSLDGRIQGLWTDTPYLLLGSTRGVYLEGYGAVFTAEVNLVTNPVSLMSPRVSKPEVARIRQQKIERLSVLKKTLRESLISMAASLDTVPADEQIAIVAFIDHYPWEDISGIPVQLTVQAQKKTLLGMQHAAGAQLEAAIHVTEN